MSWQRSSSMEDFVHTLKRGSCTTCTVQAAIQWLGQSFFTLCLLQVGCILFNVFQLPISSCVFRTSCQARVSIKGSTVVSTKGGHLHEDSRALIQTLLVEENNIQRAAATPKVLACLQNVFYFLLFQAKTRDMLSNVARELTEENEDLLAYSSTEKALQRRLARARVAKKKFPKLPTSVDEAEASFPVDLKRTCAGRPFCLLLSSRIRLVDGTFKAAQIFILHTVAAGSDH